MISLTMSGENGKSWKIEIIPLWLKTPCCILTPSSTASSPVAMPPLIRESKALAVPPVVTPGTRRVIEAAARVRFELDGQRERVSGAMPSSWSRRSEVEVSATT